jgi:hypothetical protein
MPFLSAPSAKGYQTQISELFYQWIGTGLINSGTDQYTTNLKCFDFM